MNILDEFIQKAKADKKTIVLPESNDIRVLRAAAMIQEQGIADIILIGNGQEIKKLAEGLDISKARIVDPVEFEWFEDYVNTFYEMRKAKGITVEKAREIMQDCTYFGVMMVKKGHADGMVSGAAHSTADTLRPALQILKTAPGISLVSTFFIMAVPDCKFGENGILAFADCALNENPKSAELADIAISTARSFKAFTRIEPRVAMLSYSSHGSAKSELTDKVVQAVQIAREKDPTLTLDGELQLDAAIVPSVGKSKAPGSKVAGSANVLIFPDLNSGNIGYKLVQRFAKAEAYGPVTQGLAKPVNDLSRGCSAEDIAAVVAITAIQAQNA